MRVRVHGLWISKVKQRREMMTENARAKPSQSNIHIYDGWNLERILPTYSTIERVNIPQCPCPVISFAKCCAFCTRCVFVQTCRPHILVQKCKMQCPNGNGTALGAGVQPVRSGQFAALFNSIR